jgi:hypothetical protein
MNKPLRTIAIKGHEISSYRLSSGRYMVVWYDSNGVRQRRSRATLKGVDELVEEVSEAIQKRVNGEMTLDDRQAYNLAREIAEGHNYTVLQAMRECWSNTSSHRDSKAACTILWRNSRRPDFELVYYFDIITRLLFPEHAASTTKLQV